MNSQNKEDNLKLTLFNNFLKLITKFASSYYLSIKQWNKYPTNEELSNEVKVKEIINKVSLTIKVLISHAEKNSHQKIKQILSITEKLLQSKNILSYLTKLNLLVNNAITLLHLCDLKEKNDESKISEIMKNYHSNIIRNFISAYNNTFASLIATIANNLSLFLNDKSILFDYQEFFIDEDKYLNEIIVPNIQIATHKLNNILNDNNFVSDFELDTLNYEDDLDLLHYMTVLFEIKDLVNYRMMYTEKEYFKYRNSVKDKVINERKQKRIEASAQNIINK